MITPPADYTPRLLPETIEVAFGMIRSTGARLLESARMRRLTPPVLLPGTDDKDEISIEIPSVDSRLVLPRNIEQWKRRRVADYGLGAGHGIYTYIIRIDTHNNQWPVSDRWECMRPLDPEDCKSATLTQAVSICFGRMRKIATAIATAFPHLGSSLPATMPVIDLPTDSELPHIAREREVIAITDKDSMKADIYMWNDVAGTTLHVAGFSISDCALSWWMSPSALAVRLLRLHSVAEIFPF